VLSKDTILFDLDGTLLDTKELILLSFQHTFREHLGIEVAREELLENFGEPLWNTLSRYTDGDLEPLVATYREHNLGNHDLMVEAFPGTKEIMSELKGRGFRVGVVTSKLRQSALKGLRLCRLEEYVECLITLDDSMPKHKPDPLPILLALEQLAVCADQAIMVGDSPADLGAAKAAGVDSAIVSWSVFPLDKLEKPTYWLKQWEDLLEIVEM